MENVSLLFDESGELLGELSTRDGAYQHTMLTRVGEERLGDPLTAWQTQGVPIGSRRIQFRDSRCLSAIDDWLRCMKMELYPTTDLLLECWQILASHSLAAHERRDVLRSLRGASPQELAAWRLRLDDCFERSQCGGLRRRAFMDA